MHVYQKAEYAKAEAIIAKSEVASNVVTQFVEKEKIVYRDKVRTVTKELPVIINRPVYKNVCLDEDGADAFNTLMGN